MVEPTTLLANDGWLWVGLLVLALLFTGAIAGLMAGLLGVGGGIVIVPVLYHLFSSLEVDQALRMHLAIGTSLAVIVPTSLISARAHHARNSLDLALLRSIGPWVMFGAFVGGWLASLIDGTVLTGLFALIALLVAVNMALERAPSRWHNGLPKGAARGTLGALVGTLSALMGIGGGTIGVPILTACGYPIRRAVGTASGLGVLIGLPGVVGFLIAGADLTGRLPGSLGYVNLIGFALIVPMTLAMAPVGAAFAHRLHPKALRLTFAAFLTLTALRMFVDLYSL